MVKPHICKHCTRVWLLITATKPSSDSASIKFLTPLGGSRLVCHEINRFLVMSQPCHGVQNHDSNKRHGVQGSKRMLPATGLIGLPLLDLAANAGVIVFTCNYVYFNVVSRWSGITCQSECLNGKRHSHNPMICIVEGHKESGFTETSLEVGCSQCLELQWNENYHYYRRLKPCKWVKWRTFLCY